MKNKILTSLLLSLLLLTTNVNAAIDTATNWEEEQQQVTTNPDWKVESLENEIESVEIISDKSIKINLKEYINFKDSYVNWEFTVLREWKTESSIKDEKDEKVIILKLKEDLEKNSNYNILAIEWTNASIEFTTTESLENQVIKNSAELKENGIEFITIVDKNNIKLHFKDKLETQDFNFKLFEIISIKDKKGEFLNEKTSITATLNKNLDKNASYMLTILELKTSKGDIINFSGGWYKDFGNIVATEKSNSEAETTLEELALENNDTLETTNTALSTEETPETGPATNILILLTLLLTWVYFVTTRRKI